MAAASCLSCLAASRFPSIKISLLRWPGRRRRPDAASPPSRSELRSAPHGAKPGEKPSPPRRTDPPTIHRLAPSHGAPPSSIARASSARPSAPPPRGAIVAGCWGRSSAGRASRSQCEGQEFDPPRLHQSFPKALMFCDLSHWLAPSASRRFIQAVQVLRLNKTAPGWGPFLFLPLSTCR